MTSSGLLSQNSRSSLPRCFHRLNPPLSNSLLITSSTLCTKDHFKNKTDVLYIFGLYCIHRAVVGLLMFVSPSRQEYRPWTGVRPAKSARRNPPAQYPSPGIGAAHVSRETSYQAAYSWEAERSTELLQGENIILSASRNIQPAAVHQPLPTALQAGSSMSSSGLQQSILPERTELSGMAKGEVQ